MNPFKTIITIAIALFALFCLQARTFRQFQPIASPTAVAEPESPEGFQPAETIEPVATSQVKEAVEQLTEAWNQGSASLGGVLGESFYDKQRLLNSRSLESKVSFDAEIEVLGISNIKTLSQFVGNDEMGNASRMSQVSVDVRTQITFDDADNGYQRIEGTNQYILEITEQWQ